MENIDNEKIEEEKEIQEARKLREAKQMQEARETGKTIDDIAEDFNCSPTTVRRRLRYWEKHVGKEPASEEETERGATILQTVFGILDAEKTAEKIGEITGADIATIEGILRRIKAGKATKAEISKLFANVTGAIAGYFGGREVFTKAEESLPEREPLVENPEKEKKAEKILVTVGGSSKKKKKKDERDE